MFEYRFLLQAINFLFIKNLLYIATAASLLCGGPAYGLRSIVNRRNNSFISLVQGEILQQNLVSLNYPFDSVAPLGEEALTSNLEWRVRGTLSEGMRVNPVLIFDFGTNNINIDRIYIWNGLGNAGLNDFALFADDNLNLNDGFTTLGTYNVTQQAETISSLQPEVFNFEDTRSKYRYFYLSINSNHGNPDYTALHEIAFEQVPFEFSLIPGIAFILGAGGINYFQRKGKKGQK